MLVIGRVMLGWGVGFANQAVPLYLSEIAPAHIRGTLNIMFQMATTIGELDAGDFLGCHLRCLHCRILPTKPAEQLPPCLGLWGVLHLLQACPPAFCQRCRPPWLTLKLLPCQHSHTTCTISIQASLSVGIWVAQYWD